MRKILFAVLVLILGGAVCASAQQADLGAPITRTSITNYKVENQTTVRGNGGTTSRWEMEVSQRDATDAEAGPRLKFSGPDALGGTADSVIDFADALDTPIAGETGNTARKMNARLLNFLKTRCTQGGEGLCNVTITP